MDDALEEDGRMLCKWRRGSREVRERLMRYQRGMSVEAERSGQSYVELEIVCGRRLRKRHLQSIVLDRQYHCEASKLHGMVR